MPPTNMFPVRKNSSEPVTQGQCGDAAQMTILTYECIFTGNKKNRETGIRLIHGHHWNLEQSPTSRVLHNSSCPRGKGLRYEEYCQEVKVGCRGLGSIPGWCPGERKEKRLK